MAEKTAGYYAMKAWYQYDDGIDVLDERNYEVEWDGYHDGRRAHWEAVAEGVLRATRTVASDAPSVPGGEVPPESSPDEDRSGGAPCRYCGGTRLIEGIFGVGACDRCAPLDDAGKP